MKTAITTATLIISLFCARLTAADATPATLSIERQFQQADIQLAIQQYKKLRMAAFDLELKTQTETAQSDEQRKHLGMMRHQLQDRAEEVRATALKAAAVAVAKSQ